MCLYVGPLPGRVRHVHLKRQLGIESFANIAHRTSLAAADIAHALLRALLAGGGRLQARDGVCVCVRARGGVSASFKRLPGSNTQNG